METNTITPEKAEPAKTQITVALGPQGMARLHDLTRRSGKDFPTRFISEILEMLERDVTEEEFFNLNNYTFTKKASE